MKGGGGVSWSPGLGVGGFVCVCVFWGVVVGVVGGGFEGGGSTEKSSSTGIGNGGSELPRPGVA